MKWCMFVRRSWPVTAGALAGGVAAVLISSGLPNEYEASTRLFLGSPASSDSAGAYNGDLFSQQRAATYAQLVHSEDLAVKVIDDLGLSTSPEELVSKVTGAQVPRTVLMELSAVDTSGQAAADLANTYADNLVEYIARLETPVNADQPSSEVTVIQTAEPPQLPASPNYFVNGVIGVLAGSVIALLSVWVFRKLDKTVRGPEDLVGLAGVPLLGVLPRDKNRRRSPMDNRADATTPYAESVRKLRTNFLYSDVDSAPIAVAFASPTSTDTCTAAMTNLAIALDGIDHQCVVVEGDIRKSRLARYVGDDSDKGLSEVLAGDVALEDAICQVPHTEVGAVYGGNCVGASSDLLASAELGTTLTCLRQLYDHVFIGAPEVISSADAAVIGIACDGVILTTVSGSTRIDDVHSAVETLRNVGVTILGAVLVEAR